MIHNNREQSSRSTPNNYLRNKSTNMSINVASFTPILLLMSVLLALSMPGNTTATSWSNDWQRRMAASGEQTTYKAQTPDQMPPTPAQSSTASVDDDHEYLSRLMDSEMGNQRRNFRIACLKEAREMFSLGLFMLFAGFAIQWFMDGHIQEVLVGG